MLFIPLHVKFNFDAAVRRRRSRLCPCGLKKDRHFSLFFQVILRFFHFFRLKAATFQNNVYLCNQVSANRRNATLIKVRFEPQRRCQYDLSGIIIALVLYSVMSKNLGNPDAPSFFKRAATHCLYPRHIRIDHCKLGGAVSAARETI